MNTANFDAVKADLAIADQIDELTLLCLNGRPATALAIAQEDHAPLSRSLSLAAIYSTLGDVDAMQQVVAEATLVAPGTSLVLQAEAILAAIQGDTAAAVEKANKAVLTSNAGEGAARAQIGLARAMLLHGNSDKFAREDAIEMLKSMANFGKDPEANLVLAEELGDNGDKSRFDYFAAAFVAKPRDPRPMQSLLNLFREQSWPIGVGVFARHLRDITDSDELRLMADYINLAAGLYISQTPWKSLLSFTDETFECAREAARPFPPRVQCTLVSLLIDHGRFVDANAVLDEISANLGTPEDYGHHAFTRGRLLQTQGDFEGAHKAYARAVEIDPKHIDAANNFVDISLSLGTEEGVSAAGRVILGVPVAKRRNHLQLSYNEALWREARGDYDDALKVVASLLEGPAPGLETHILNLQGRLKRALTAN